MSHNHRAKPSRQGEPTRRPPGPRDYNGFMRVQRFADLPVRIEQREITVEGRGQTYGLLIPKAAAEAAGYPMIVGLHYYSPTPGLSPYFGLGFVGQLVLPALEELNAILVAPDAPDASWTTATSEHVVAAVIGEVQKENATDRRRTLVTGFSMGGEGAWFMAAKHSDLFRGAIPIAAPPPPADLKLAMPVYVIHSRADEAQAFDATQGAVRTLEGAGANITFAPLDDVPHQDATQYVDALHGAIPWIRKIWT